MTLRDTLANLNFNPEDYLQDIVEFDLYATKDVTMKNTLGTYYEELINKYPYLSYNSMETFIKVSDYNKLAKLFSQEEYTLNKNEYILIADYKELADIRKVALERNTPIRLGKEDYKPKYQEVKNGFIFMNSTHANAGVFIVPDEAVNALQKEQSILAANYKGTTEEEKQIVENKITIDMENHPYAKKTNLGGTTKIALYEASIGLGAMVTFIGLYLGIIFLISSAAILALKELSESTDNAVRFAMLRKIGTDEEMLNKALFYQIAIFFIFPLGVAMIHSIFGIKFCNFILATFGNEKLLPSIIMTSIFLGFIYGGYLLITYFVSKNIMKEK